MKFRLRQFAKNELKQYKVTRLAEYDFKNPNGTPLVFAAEMVIYKKAPIATIADPVDGLHIKGQMTGKCLQSIDLRNGDIVEVFGLKYRVIELLPRIYADFSEFGLELMRNEI